MNILALVAHPDDAEILCAGTLARYAADGHRITLAIFTDGSMGDREIPPATLAGLRRAEAEEAAGLLGARLLWGGIVDEHVFPDAEQRRRVIDLLRESDPDVILTHHPGDYHPDHRHLAQLVFDSYFQKGLPFVPGQKLPACRFGEAQVYHLDTVGGIGNLPADYVDITPVMELKRRMLRCHRSQFKAMSDLAHCDLEQLVEIQARFRGLAAGCLYAEGFTRLESWQRGSHRRLLP
mgnify:CR=1 FL=1